jgi:hypothetical protein
MTKKRDIFKLLEELENAGCFFGQALRSRASGFRRTGLKTCSDAMGIAALHPSYGLRRDLSHPKSAEAETLPGSKMSLTSWRGGQEFGNHSGFLPGALTN